MPLKPVIILADHLPPGPRANFTAVLGMSLGRMRPDLLGPDTPAQDGAALAGITTVALPGLAAPAGDLPGLFDAAADLPLRLVYQRAAFEARDDADYSARIAAAPLADHAPQAILLAGPCKAVDRICASPRLLR